tara:strand:+ start:16705 stop:17859 length:1155 start_codon:yes stop_codon:yes gene_type:complete
MELLNLTKDDIFKNKDIDNSNRIDFYESYSDTGIYNKEAYLQDRPIYNEFIKDYNIEPVNNNFNQMIHKRKVKEEKEIAENLAEISITSDPRITKYEDTYSLTPYATYLLTPLSDIDGEDIVSRFDSCYGEWVNIGKCPKKEGKNKCKKVLQEFIIHNPGYTGEHCRNRDGRRLRDGDTRRRHCYKDCKHPKPGPVITKCSSFTNCTGNHILDPTKSNTPCPAGVCTDTLCCKAKPPTVKCSSFTNCDANRIPDSSKSDNTCPDNVCTDALCCKAKPPPATVKCSSFTNCDANRIPDSSKSGFNCPKNSCKDAFCCKDDRIGTCKCTKPAFPDEFPDLCYDGGDDKGITRHKSFCIDQTKESDCINPPECLQCSPNTCTFVPKP